MATTKITLNELKSVIKKFVNENIEGQNSPINKLEFISKKISNNIDNIYRKISNLSVSEILNNEIDLEELNKSINNYETILMNAEKSATDFINNISEEEYDKIGYELDTRIYNIYKPVSDKINSVSIILNPLIEMKEKSIEHKINDVFAHIRPMEI